MVGATNRGMIKKLAEPMTRFRPGLNIKLISRTSLVARAIRSPVGCRSWKDMLLPMRLAYSSSRVSRSRRWPITSAEKLRINCSTPRTNCDPAIRTAATPRPRRSGDAAMTASKACPVSTGTTEASAALLNAPTSIPRMNNLWRNRCDQIQRTGPRRSACQVLVTANSLMVMRLVYRQEGFSSNGHNSTVQPRPGTSRAISQPSSKRKPGRVGSFARSKWPSRSP